MEKKELFTRHSRNPLLNVKDLPYKANSLFNTGATKFNDTTLLLMRVEDRRGISHLTKAVSSDGITNWKCDEKPTLMPQPDRHPEEFWGIEDPRISYLSEIRKWAVAYTSFSKAGPLVSIALTDDFITFERIGIVLPPENKDAAIFPEKVNGQWAMLHRPVSTFPGTGAHIWIAFSDDLIHWGKHKLLLKAREGSWWDAEKIGASTPPLKTDEGWLILYHGVKRTVSGCIYRLGLALLDLDDPCKVISRGDEWIFSPEEKYEMIGDVDKVVFPCGWIIEDDEVRLYYGCADKSISMATAKLSELLQWVKKYEGRQ